jgi:peptide/nickel transport system substrate-binding protein
MIRNTLSESLMAFERPLPRSRKLNLAESYTFLDGGRELRIKLRKGVRWSDGVPFTVDDILFWYNDILTDENARQAPFFPDRWKSQGQPVEMEKEDDLTLIISSDAPLGVILDTLCHDDIALPKHILAQYHPRYNSDSDYDRLRRFTRDGRLAFEPGIPRLSAWVPVEWARGQRAVYRRNPYYWKVDTEGNQLPYADALEFAIIPNNQVQLLKFQNGELDFLSHGNFHGVLSTMKVKEREGVFRLNRSVPTQFLVLFPNWDAPEPTVRRALRDRRVRIALSHAINRPELGRVIFDGRLIPSGFSLSRSSPYYSEETSKLYSQYDPEKARALLGEAGYIDSDGDGYREFEDGSRFELLMDVLGYGMLPDLSELVAEYWEAIGIRVRLNIGLEEIIVPRRINAEFVITTGSAPVDPLNQAHEFAITGPYLPVWHRNAGAEAPPWLREMTALIKKAKTTMDDDIRGAYLIRIRDLITENIPFICFGADARVWGSNRRLGNVPYLVNSEDLYRALNRAVPHEQVFIRP